VIVWMDHRALAEAEAINQTGHEVLRYVGGSISPEMETPKLSWLKRHLPVPSRRPRASWICRLLELPRDRRRFALALHDVCKWTYLGHENAGRGAWSKSFFEKIGLAKLLEDGARRIGSQVRPVGDCVGRLLEPSAREARPSCWHSRRGIRDRRARGRHRLLAVGSRAKRSTRACSTRASP